jgi:hypothetical protein
MNITIVVGALVGFGIVTAPGGLRAQGHERTDLGPESGSVLSIIIDQKDSSIVHASTPVGLFKSHDQGANWRNLFALMPVNVYAVLMDPRDSMHVYAATDEGVMGRANRGESWALMRGSPAFSRVLALDSQDAGILYTGGLGGLFSTGFCRQMVSTDM